MVARYHRAAKVFTAADETTFAGAFAVEYGRFNWLGNDVEIPRDVQVEDLGGSRGAGPRRRPNSFDVHRDDRRLGRLHRSRRAFDPDDALRQQPLDSASS